MKRWLLPVILVLVAIGIWFVTSRPEPVQVTLYFSDQNAEFLRPELRRVVLDKGESPIIAAIEGLIHGPQDQNLSRTIPEGTRLLGIEIKDGVAWVDFSREIQINHWGGSAGEMLTTFSVVNTLTEFPQIQAVQFLVEGEVLESIWGHGITDEPIGRAPDLIAPK